MKRLWDENQAAKAQVESQGRKLERLRFLEKYYRPDLMKIRKVVLYNVGRNSWFNDFVAQGGNILVDIDLLSEQHNEFQVPGVIETCREGFKQLYMLPPETSIQVWNDKDDDRLIALFNLRANMHIRWLGKQSPGSEKLSKCNAILEQWCLQPSSWHEPEVVALVNEIFTWANDWQFPF